MLERVVEVATDSRHLSLRDNSLVISESGKAVEVGRVPLRDIGALILNAHGITYSNSLLVALAESGVPAVFCADNHSAAGYLIPTKSHHEQAKRLRSQVSVTLGVQRRLWAEIVKAKIVRQADVVAAAVGGDAAKGLTMLAHRVKSGDPQNLEAQAARRYWPILMGPDFRRTPSLPGINGMLNYGYAVLRSTVARAVLSAGLHPSLGVKHHNAGNPMCLVDDLIEPFRPVVDLLVWHLVNAGELEVTKAVKLVLGNQITLPVPMADDVTSLSLATVRLAQSFAQCISGKQCSLDLPTGISPDEVEARAHEFHS